MPQQWCYGRHLDASRGFHAMFRQLDIELITKPLIKLFMQMLWVVAIKNIACQVGSLVEKNSVLPLRGPLPRNLLLFYVMR